ncbi:MAG: HypC/HybG/HupF family hydrogenase formation chaperone [Candidatus Hydrothermales bacterium]
MCLGIPGKIVNIYEKDGVRFAKVEFGGIKREVCLDLTPEAKEGDYVIVHVGFSIQILDQKEAEETLNTYREFLEKIEKNEVSL